MAAEATEHGYVPVSRKFFDEDPLWNEPREFSRAEAWIDLVRSAAHTPHRRMVQGVCVRLRRGQLLASERFLAERWGWTKGKVRRFLQVLQEPESAGGLERITVQAEHPASRLGALITLVNYDRWNPTDGGVDNRPVSRPLDQRTDQPTDQTIPHGGTVAHGSTDQPTDHQTGQPRTSDGPPTDHPRTKEKKEEEGKEGRIAAAAREPASAEMWKEAERVAAELPPGRRRDLLADARKITSGLDTECWKDPSGKQAPEAERPRLFALALLHYAGKDGEIPLRGCLRYVIAQQLDGFALPKAPAPAGSEAAAVRARGEPAGGGPAESRRHISSALERVETEKARKHQQQEDDERVAAWAEAHPDDAAALEADCWQDPTVEAMPAKQRARERYVQALFRRRVLEEKLRPAKTA